MSNIELIGIYNCFNQSLNLGASKEEIHQKGLWHRTINFLIVNPSFREVIFQEKKGLEAFTNPDYFVKINGGHIQQNESLEEGFREMEEELGLQIPPTDCHYLGKCQVSFEAGNFKNNEFMHFYLVPAPEGFESINFNDGEVGSIVKFNIDEALDMLLDKKQQIPAQARNSQMEQIDLTLSKNNFKNFTDNDMYLKLMIAAKRYLDGENKETIII